MLTEINLNEITHLFSFDLLSFCLSLFLLIVYNGHYTYNTTALVFEEDKGALTRLDHWQHAYVRYTTPRVHKLGLLSQACL